MGRLSGLGYDMLKKQLEMAEKKGNSEAAGLLKAEMDRRYDNNGKPKAEVHAAPEPEVKEENNADS